MAARGSLDSGNQLAMELKGQQDAAESEATAGANTAAQAQARMFAAIRERANQAGAGLDRSYNQQSRAASAQDAINAGNTAIANTAAKYNAGLPQQDFNNSLALAGAKAQPTYALAGAHAAAAKDTQQQYQGYGNMVGAAAKSGYDSYKSNNSGSSSPNSAPTDLSNLGDSFSSGGANGAGNSTSDALSSETTRPRAKEVVGYDDNGKPIYGYRTAA